MHFIFFSFGGWALIRGWALKKYFLGGGRLFEVGRLKSTFWGRVLIRGWALINFFYLQGGRVFEIGHLIE